MNLTDARVLLVDDTEANLDMLCELLEPEGYRIAMAPNGEIALKIAERLVPELILLDVMMPGIDGFEVCRRLKSEEKTASIPVIFVTAQGLTESLVNGFEVGGVDYISKPFQNEEVLMRVRTHLSITRLSRELAEKNEELVHRNRELEEEIALRKVLKGQVTNIAEREAKQWGLEAIVGSSPTIEQILEDIHELQDKSGASVLVTGEEGVGKELAARAIHYGSARRDGPFVPVNCGEIPEDVIASLDQRTQALSLLFGHVRGAFAGADEDRDGYFQMAHGGTLYFDEIDRIPVPLQAGLMRALESGEVRRLGDPTGLQVDVRLVAATRKDLANQVAAGEFREDLCRVLSRSSVHVAPLRERPEDIPLLAQHFLQLSMKQVGRDAEELSAEVLAALAEYDYPGNVRELKSIIEHAVIESGGHEIGVEHLRLQGVAAGVGEGSVPA